MSKQQFTVFRIVVGSISFVVLIYLIIWGIKYLPRRAYGPPAAAINTTMKEAADYPNVINTFDGYKTYSEMSDGTWQCEGQIYKYRLEIHGRMNNDSVDSTYIYLSNVEDISFDRAWKASGLSSDMSDYFSKEEAVFVDWVSDR